MFMRKRYFFAAAAAAMLAACSSNDALESAQNGGTVQAPLEEGAIGFDAYTNRSVTRAGDAGLMDTEKLKETGFGVFGFYTDNNDYDQQRMPDFMYNQLVKHGGNGWEYSPVKYWPNEYGTTAISDDQDKVSFFAYAPYVEVVPSTGKITATPDSAKWGITGMSRNSASGDPLIKYIASFDQDKSVDLLWGVCDDPQWSIVETGSKQLINDGQKGFPWVNVFRPQGIDQRLKFTFHHALTQLSVNIDAFVDGYNNSIPLDKGSKIYVRQISFSGFAMKGCLNLNNSEEANKAYWLDFNGTTDLESGENVIVYDGRKDGKEGASGSVASNEKTLGLNPVLIQDTEWGAEGQQAGVTNTPVPLFRNYDKAQDKYVASTAPLMVIPTGEDIEIEIVYDVETPDKNLATYLSDKKTTGSSIENRIRKSVSFGGENFECGKHYTINLHLGMNSVKFDAEVGDWIEVPVEVDVDLPSNLPTFTAVNSANASEYTYPVSIDSDKAEYIFAVEGLNGGEGVTATATLGNVAVNSKADFSGNDGIASNSGIAYVKISNIPENTDILNKLTAAAVTVEGKASGAKQILDITQLAHPLGLSAESISDSYKSIYIASTSSVSGAKWQTRSTGATEDDFYIEVSKNGTKMDKKDSNNAAKDVDGAFFFNKSQKQIVLGTPASPSDIYTITIKTGDAYEETINVKIGGIAYANQGLIELPYGTTGYINPLTVAGVDLANVTYSTSNAQVSVGENGKITTLVVASKESTIATITATASEMEDGYVATTSGKTATYTVKVRKAVNSVIAPNSENLTVKLSDIKGTGEFDLNNAIQLKNANGDVMEVGTSATQKAGKVNYVFASETYGANDKPASGNRYSVADGKLKMANPGANSSKVNQLPAVGDKITITATVDATGNNNVSYADGKNTTSITIEVVAD